MIKITQLGDAVKLENLQGFSADRTFDCGQCFRFEKSDESWCGVAFGKYITFTQTAPDTLVISPCLKHEVEEWIWFLRLDEDYTLLQQAILAAARDYGAEEIMTAAIQAGHGIRILRQDSWEALCSFIISQNNNIGRIKKNIFSISSALGTKISCDNDNSYTFPKPEALCGSSEEELRKLGLGFRAKYVLNAAEMICSGKIDLLSVAKSDINQGLETLMAIKGVGPKVAACALLFGFGKGEAFPEDVWIKRSLLRLPAGFNSAIFGENAGLAQQYLFYLERYTKG